jgi:hypothetical protein
MQIRKIGSGNSRIIDILNNRTKINRWDKQARLSVPSCPKA